MTRAVGEFHNSRKATYLTDTEDRVSWSGLYDIMDNFDFICLPPPPFPILSCSMSYKMKTNMVQAILRVGGWMDTRLVVDVKYIIIHPEFFLYRLKIEQMHYDLDLVYHTDLGIPT